jgi:non-specific serine/threonine protein kinase
MPARYRPDHDRCMSRIRRGLPTKEFEDGWREGRLRERDAAIELALVAAAAATADRPRPGPRLLSQREEIVASLVAQGLTNRDIAHRLSVSGRTAESHVEHIRNKLGFRSRSQIAAWVAEKSLLPP